MIEYRVDVPRRIVTTRVHGRLSLGDFTDHLQRVFRDPKFSFDFNALIVATSPSAIPTRSSIELIKPLVRAWSRQRAGAKWAFVLPDAEAKVFVEAVLLDLRLTSVISRCFTSEAAALAWLEPVRDSSYLHGRPGDNRASAI